MSYQSGDDPQLLSDLRAALKRWHRPTLGDVALAHGLAGVERRLAADPSLTRSNALRQTVRAALDVLQDRQRGEQADLLERRYLRDERIPLITETYALSERSIYHRLHEAYVALAHALWALEQTEQVAAAGLPVAGPLPTLSRARHLPPQTYSRRFGRDKVLARLLDYLDDHSGHWLISLDGMAGLGKTTLAREAASHLARTSRFADIAWVTIRPVAFTGHGPQQVDLPALTCGQVLDAIASQLGGMDLGSLPLSAKRDGVRALLRAGSYLVVLDNLETAMDCGSLPDWFWDMAEPSKFLLTSRHWLRAGGGATVISLDQLDEPESLAILRHEARLRGLAEVADASEEALLPILAVTGGNPLALKLVVGQLVSLPLNRVLAALKTAHPSTDSFYRYLYRASWDLISGPAQHLLKRAAGLPVDGGRWETLSIASALADDELASAIEELTAHSLLQAAGFEEKIYSIHPLTRHFVLSQAVQAAETEGP